jgi:hypothetical protein
MGWIRLSGSGRPWVPIIWLLEGRLGAPCQAGASQGDRAETLGREVAVYVSVGKLGRTSGSLDWSLQRCAPYMQCERARLSGWGRSTSTPGVAVIGHFDCTLQQKDAWKANAEAPIAVLGSNISIAAKCPQKDTFLFSQPV